MRELIVKKKNSLWNLGNATFTFRNQLKKHEILSIQKAY